MTEPFAQILTAGNHANSLGRSAEVITTVLDDKKRLEELYICLFNEDAWVRMRAADALEKICRVHPEWLLPYIDRFTNELLGSNQASIQWHLAQIYRQVSLSDTQKHTAINWLQTLLSSKNIDWIVAANAMDTLVAFTTDGSFPVTKMRALLKIQQTHASKSVVKRANKLLDALQ